MESPSTSSLSADRAPTPRSHLYRLDLAYIGSDFFGWQSQPHGNTVQDHLEKALGILLREKIRILGASRTDTGVHAEHQVATFRTDAALDCARVMRSLSAIVPPSLGILDLRPYSKEFHPIVHARSKLYRYRLWQGPGLGPFARPFVWPIPQKLDLDALEVGAKQLIGRHNFRSFCASDGSARTFERTIYDARWIRRGPLLEFYILGEGFLKQMVRSLVGTLVEMGAGKRSAAEMGSLLAAEDRTMAGQTAPAAGLSLVNIFYEEQHVVPSLFLEANPLLGFWLQPPCPPELRG